jgi:hypothetical protein
MRLGLHLIAATLFVVTLMGCDGRVRAAVSTTKSLVFEGTVTSIRTIDDELTPCWSP